MYVPDELDEVVPMEDVPLPDYGSPLPTILAQEHLTTLAYYLPAPPDESFDGIGFKTVRVVTEDSHGSLAMVTFRMPYAQLSYAAGDYRLAKHPLGKRGLEIHGVFEVRHSTWARETAPSGRALRHYIFSFHDSMFECLAEEIAFKVFEGSLKELVKSECFR